MAGVRGGMHANRATDPTKLSCSEYAGPKGEGKFRLDPRQAIFTSLDVRFRVRKSDSYKENLGPGSYPNYDQPIYGAHRPPGDWMPRALRFEHESGRVTEDMLRDTSFNFEVDFRQNWVKDPGCGNIVLDKDSRFKENVHQSPCKAGFYDTSRSIDYLRYPGRSVYDEGGRVTPEGTNAAKFAFESRSERFPDDPAAHLGPGSHDAVTPDERIKQKKLLRRDPSFANAEIINEPIIERTTRHGDPSEGGPGSYDLEAERPSILNDPLRPSSSFLLRPRSDKDHRTTAGHVGACHCSLCPSVLFG